jgi:hypothetical protein
VETVDVETVDLHLIGCSQLSGKCIEKGLRQLLEKIYWIKLAGSNLLDKFTVLYIPIHLLIFSLNFVDLVILALLDGDCFTNF